MREQDEDVTLAALRDVARERGIVVHIGSLAVRNGDKIANRAFLIDAEGAITASYDKLHLYDVDLPNGERWRESNTYTGGPARSSPKRPGRPSGSRSATTCVSRPCTGLWRKPGRRSSRARLFHQADR